MEISRFIYERTHEEGMGRGMGREGTVMSGRADGGRRSHIGWSVSPHPGGLYKAGEMPFPARAGQALLQGGSFTVIRKQRRGLQRTGAWAYFICKPASTLASL